MDRLSVFYFFHHFHFQVDLVLVLSLSISLKNGVIATQININPLDLYEMHHGLNECTLLKYWWLTDCIISYYVRVSLNGRVFVYELRYYQFKTQLDNAILLTLPLKFYFIFEK